MSNEPIMRGAFIVLIGKSRFICFLILFTSIMLTCVGCQKKDNRQIIGKKDSFSQYVAVTTIGELNVRIQPHTESARVLLLNEGMVLDIIGRTQNPVSIANTQDYWYHIRAENGISGWVYGAYLILVKKTANNEEAYELALEQIRQQKANTLQGLAGDWVEVSNDGVEGRNNLKILADGRYYAYKKGLKELYIGEIDVKLKVRILELTNNTPFGRRLNFQRQESGQYALSHSQYGNHFQFQRSEEVFPKISYFQEEKFKIIQD